MNKIALLFFCLLLAFTIHAQRSINPRNPSFQPVPYSTLRSQPAPVAVSAPVTKNFETKNGVLKLDSFNFYRYTSSNDSTLFSRNILRYTSDGKNYFRNTISLWGFYEKKRYTYDETGRSFDNVSKNTAATKHYTWYEKCVDAYDTSGNYFGQSRNTWDLSANDWLPVDKFEQYYGNSGNKPVTKDWYMWETINRGLHFIERDWYYVGYAWALCKPFYGTGYDTLTLQYVWDNDKSQWVNSFKRENQFDENGYLTVSKHFDWSVTENKWLPNLKQEFQHGADGLDTIFTGYKFDDTKADWIFDWADSLTYDEHGNMIQIIFTQWNEGKSTVDNWSKVTYKYDDNNNFTESDIYSYDTVNKEFVVYYKEFYRYDEFGNGLFVETLMLDGSSNEKKFWYWSLTGVSSDASLWDVSVSQGILKPVIDDNLASLVTLFNDEINNYVVMIDSSVTNPTLTVEKNDPNSSFVVNNAADITSANKADRTATITVTAEDGTTKQDYSFEFHWMDHLATLSSLSVSEGTLSPEFSPDVFEYYDTLYGSCNEKVATPTIAYKATSDYAYSKLTAAFDICGSTANRRTSLINIIADDGVTKNTYKVIFTVVEPNTINTLQTKDLLMYPNPSQNIVYIEHIRPISEVTVYNLMGQGVGMFATTNSKNYVLDLSELRSGMYYIRVTDEESNIYVQKVIKE